MLIIAAALLAIISACSAGTAVDLDHAVFRANDSLSYVEVFASVQRAHLKYTDIGDSSRAAFMLKLDVLLDTNVVLSDTFRAVDAVLKTERPSRGQFFPHVFRFVMKPGTYRLRALLFQNETELRDVSVDTLGVRAFKGHVLALSDVELGCRMEHTDEPSQFAKNGILILPNPTRFYGTDLPMFYYYAEVYGLAFDSSAADSYSVTHRVVYAENRATARPETQRTRPVIGSSLVVADGFPVSTLRTGTYEFELVVTSHKTGQSAQARKKFWTYRPDEFQAGRMPAPNAEFDSRRLSAAQNALDITDPDSALKLMKYVLTKDQSKQASRLNTEGKRQFIQAVWKEREVSDPGAANRYFARVAEANSRWDYLHRQGWKTDRGRIFVTYGEPDAIDRNYAVTSVTDFEVWRYDRLEGGVIFVFADVRGFGDLELVHSTMRGEISNPSWNTGTPNTRPREDMR
jgi:GWxTD domain-containing protein